MDSLEQLKELLISEEKQQLQQLEQNTSSQKVFSQRTAAVLPQAIESLSNKPEFIASLEGAVTQCIHKSVKRDSKLYADALFPVIGPAIRMSILETFRTLISSINQAVENAFSIQGLKWRWQAWRAGVPFPDYVVSQTIAFRVEQIFLIQPCTGLLMAHVIHPAISQKADADAFSAMLTAIQQFVVDSFSVESHAHLDSVDFGDLSVMLLDSPDAVMAVAVRGIAPRSLKVQLQENLEQIIFKRGEALELFDGDRSTMIFIESMLEPLLIEQKRELSTSQQRSSMIKQRMLFASTLIALCWLLWSSVVYAFNYYRVHQAADILSATPGYVVHQVSYQSGRWVLFGLRDPLAQEPQRALKPLNLTLDGVEFRLESYFSLDKALIMKRIKQILLPPSSIQITISDGVIELQGEADYQWIEKLQQMTTINVFGFQMQTNNLVESMHSKLVRVETFVSQLPDVEMSVQSNQVVFSGYATQNWITQLTNFMAEIKVDFISENLVSFEAKAASELIDFIEKTEIIFTNTQPSSEQIEKLSRVADQMRQLQMLSNQTETPFSCQLIGHSDGVGNR
uniref:hypothetical protein n=1 Tax=Pseudoalteromonas sp. TaxID=53249 RepID=UPI003567C44C